MEKSCCDCKVTETDNGYRIEITGDSVKEKCKAVFDNCCSPGNIAKCFQGWCGSKE
ncbi:MAG: hypothetical protein AB1530_04175 [Candidatus Omnitrophota bacterium]